MDRQYGTAPSNEGDLSGVTVRVCPKCGSPYIQYQREQSGPCGVSQSGVTIMAPKKRKGCLYWLFIGWWWEPTYWVTIGWWWRLFFGGRRKKGWNLNASETINHTVAVCQNCGHSWKV